MYKLIVVVRKKPELSRERFLKYWQEYNLPYVRKLPGLLRYRQNITLRHRKQWPFDGVAELWFESLKAVAAAFETPEARSLFAHEEQFIERVEWALTQESDIDLHHAGENNRL